ncbi:hypothetical protein FRC04_006015 [Tulasnella sp. 424]|nr:hypothetical protein FRC04_006015 [Tulasnella sp. 424]KAG8975606.1 hypothetical protein FRC05_005399 [Tulasnella sp. 425]
MTRNIAAIALLSSAFLPQALASCYVDRYGRRRCSGLSNGARIGIGIAIAVVGLLVLCFAAWLRRRQMRRANKAFIVHGGQQPYQPGFNQPNQPVSRQPIGGYKNQQPGTTGTQYPAAAHTPINHSTGGPGTFNPPPGPPPPTENVLGKPPSYPGAPGENRAVANNV